MLFFLSLSFSQLEQNLLTDDDTAILIELSHCSPLLLSFLLGLPISMAMQRGNTVLNTPCIISSSCLPKRGNICQANLQLALADADAETEADLVMLVVFFSLAFSFSCLFDLVIKKTGK